jgi:putative ABC transport system ATP-binding protein
VLLDEPTAELDRVAAALVIGVLRRAASDGTTVVVATHDHDLVALADAVVELSPTPLPLSDEEQAPRRIGAEIVVIDGVTKSYAGTRVVDGASLDVRAGELCVLLGRSGSGKSTLLMVAGGWTPPDAGTVRVPGTEWQETSYLAQRFGLIPELSVTENVALPFRVARRSDEGRVRDVLGRLGLDGLGERLPGETSVGEQQRTALARALAVEPTALLADEPTSHQDAASAARVWDALARMCARGVSSRRTTRARRVTPTACGASTAAASDGAA